MSKAITKIRPKMVTAYREEIGKFAEDGANLYRRYMAEVNVPYDYCPKCGAILCSRWYNYCGRCGEKIEIEDKGTSE